MKIDVYSVMRNEIKMIPYFLRHYETFADRIFVWDDNSDDGTREILDNHPKVVLLGLTIHGLNDHYFIQKLWPQYKIISRGFADWAICVDTDEFVYHPDIVNRLQECKELGVQQIKCAGFTMFYDEFPNMEGQLYDEIKHGLPDRWSTKTIVFNPLFDIEYGIGRHYSSPGRSDIDKTINDFKILHYRYLTEEYFIERCDKNQTILYRKGNLPDGTRGLRLDWYRENKNKAVKVVD